MKNIKDERRKFHRYDTELKIHFQVFYDLKTIVRFQIIDRGQKEHLSRKYLGYSKNISVEGLCFVSKKKVEKGDLLIIEIHVPQTKTPVLTEGEVRWSEKLTNEPKYKNMFQTGVTLTKINDTSVKDSIYFDKEYKINWSIVLETIFGSYKEMLKNLKSKPHTNSCINNLNSRG